MKLHIIVGLLALTLFTAKLLLGESPNAEVQSWRSDHRNHRPNIQSWRSDHRNHRPNNNTKNYSLTYPKAEVQSWINDHINHRPKSSNDNTKKDSVTYSNSSTKHSVAYSNSSTIYEWV